MLTSIKSCQPNKKSYHLPLVSHICALLNLDMGWSYLAKWNDYDCSWDIKGFLYTGMSYVVLLDTFYVMCLPSKHRYPSINSAIHRLTDRNYQLWAIFFYKKSVWREVHMYAYYFSQYCINDANISHTHFEMNIHHRLSFKHLIRPNGSDRWWIRIRVGNDLAMNRRQTITLAEDEFSSLASLVSPGLSGLIPQRKSLSPL